MCLLDIFNWGGGGALPKKNVFQSGKQGRLRASAIELHRVGTSCGLNEIRVKAGGCAIVDVRCQSLGRISITGLEPLIVVASQ